MGKFAKQCGDWANVTIARTTAVYRRSVEMMGEEMAKTEADGGKVPFLTGALAKSLLASTSGMPRVGDSGPGVPLGIITATLQLTQPVWLGYRVAYARRVNSGFIGSDSLGRKYNQAGRYFVESAIAQWPEIVGRAAREIQTSVESRQR